MKLQGNFLANLLTHYWEQAIHRPGYFSKRFNQWREEIPHYFAWLKRQNSEDIDAVQRKSFGSLFALAEENDYQLSGDTFKWDLHQIQERLGRDGLEAALTVWFCDQTKQVKLTEFLQSL